MRSFSPFIRFLITGGFAAAVNVLSRVALSQVVSFEVAVVLAYLVGMTTAYVLARLFVFERSGQSVSSEYVRFTIVNIVALVQVWAVSVGLADWIFPPLGFRWHPELVAHVCGVISPVFTSYVGHKVFTFRAVNEH